MLRQDIYIWKVTLEWKDLLHRLQFKVNAHWQLMYRNSELLRVRLRLPQRIHLAFMEYILAGHLSNQQRHHTGWTRQVMHTEWHKKNNQPYAIVSEKCAEYFTK